MPGERGDDGDAQSSRTKRDAVVHSEDDRHALDYLQSVPKTVVTLSEIASYVARERSEPAVDCRERVEARLHHVSLPKLGERWLLDYDPRSNTVRYRGGAFLDGSLGRERHTEVDGEWTS